MQITTGLFEKQVLQRNKNNQCDTSITGRCKAAGDVELRVTSNGQAVRGFASKKVGKAVRGKFNVALKGLPTGGPYDIELSIKGTDESVAVRDVLVGDVWILGGQSNMQGVGDRPYRLKAINEVRAYYMDDSWKPAFDPIHNLWDSPDPVHNMRVENKLKPVGPGVAFGQAMYEMTGIPQGLIANAHGGTSMEQWDPKKKKQLGESLYGSLYRRLKLLNTKVSGAAWYQGESDSDPDASPLYFDRMKKLIAAIRRDTGDANLPFAIVQLARYMGQGFDELSWDEVQNAQRLLMSKVKNVATVPAIDLPMDDMIHISGDGANIVGKRLAKAIRVIREGKKAGKLPIDVGQIKVVIDKLTGLGNIEIYFENLDGGLAECDIPEGFALLDRGRSLHGIFDTRVLKDRVVLKTSQAASTLEAMYLMYGYGFKARCPLKDKAGRPVPVFGPLPLGMPMAKTDYITKLKVSKVLPAAGDLTKFNLPTDKQAGYRKENVEGAITGFADINDRLTKAGSKGVICFQFTVECDKPMKLALDLGYDGPIKAWVGKRMVYHDPKGTNPAVAGQGIAPFTAKKGKHVVTVALGDNDGNAWGIFVRIARKDVSAAVVAKGHRAWPMPKIGV